MPFPKEQYEALLACHDDDLLTKFPDYTRAELRRIRKELKDGKQSDSKEDFRNYIRKARTRREIENRFDNVDALLSENYEGFTLFEQRNDYNEQIFILLPVISDDIRTERRQWGFTIGKESNGDPQPYIAVQLPRFEGELQIATLFDIHYGHSKHRHEKFLSYIGWIRDNPNIYAICGGDLMENALDRGMHFDQSVQPHSQMDDMIRLLAPIAHKILFMLPGNHEERTQRLTGIDVTRVIADRLNVPYFTGPVFCSILANGYKWTIYAQHGHSNSQTKGGKMNAASRPATFVNNVDFLLSGHVHDRVVDSQTIVVEDAANCCLRYKTQWTVIAPSFLGWMDTYAYRAGYRPPSMGGVAINLYDNGSYKADLT
jgi:hypothetical protein